MLATKLNCKNVTFISLKLAVSVALILFVFHKAGRINFDISLIKSWNAIIAAFVVFVILLAMQCVRWMFLVGPLVMNKKLELSSFWNFYKVFWFGHLLNNVIPSSVVGDLLRNYWLNPKSSATWGGVFIIEKYLAMVSLIVMPLIAMSIGVSNSVPLNIARLAGLVALVLCMVPAVLLVVMARSSRCRRKIASVTNIENICFDWQNVVLMTVVSIVIPVLMGLVFWLSANAVGVRVEASNAIVCAPLFTILTSLPLSFAGWGVRELSVAYLLAGAGVSHEQAVIASICYGLVSLFSGIPALIFAIKSKLHKSFT